MVFVEEEEDDDNDEEGDEEEGEVDGDPLLPQLAHLPNEEEHEDHGRGGPGRGPDGPRRLRGGLEALLPWEGARRGGRPERQRMPMLQFYVLNGLVLCLFYCFGSYGTILVTKIRFYFHLELNLGFKSSHIIPQIGHITY